MSIRDKLKIFIPGKARRILSGIYYGWHGNYETWEEAKAGCTGYNSDLILEKVKKSAIMVKNGEAAYERDSVIFEKVQYSYELLSVLMWIAARNNGRLNIIDFGGSLGTTYFQNKAFLDTLPEVNLCVVEQEKFVNTGKDSFEDSRLRFFHALEDCPNQNDISTILFSSVLQYLEDPFEILRLARSKEFKFIIIDRTPFIEKQDRITIQRVNPAIYKASYPCRFFNREKFLSEMSDSYKLVFEFDSLDKSNISSEFKGMLFERELS
jgi:putative methyltransferase (TIGR04325 family)